MQTTSKLIRSRRPGFALIITLAFLTVALILFASIFSWTSSNVNLTFRNNQYNMSQAAAEGAVERVIGQMDRDFIAQSLSNATAYASLPVGIDQSDWPVKYVFSDTNGVANQISVYIGDIPATNTPLKSQYPGLYATAQDVVVTAVATPVDRLQNVPATIKQTLQFALVQIYQFAIFYNVNLEIDPGAPMTIYGPVFCNQNIWEGSGVATFSSSVTAVGSNCVATAANNKNPFFPSKTDNGTSTFLAGPPTDRANALVMPIGTNNSPEAILGLLQLPPPEFAMGTTAAYSSNGIVYPANGADLVISNAAFGTNYGSLRPRGTNTIVYFQDSSLTPVQFDYYLVTNRAAANSVYPTNMAPSNAADILSAGYSFVTNVTFKDWREGYNSGAGPAKTVEAVQLDMAKLSVWLTNKNPTYGGAKYNDQKRLHTTKNIRSAYVYNSVPLSSSKLPAVRVTNGERMPTSDGFTVATPFPMYVLGNYNVKDATGTSMGGTTNTVHTYPAALMADAITVLSTSWNDNVTTKMPVAGATTVNAAMLEGIVPSSPAGYSGGVENFLRMLEDWNGKTLTYNGSIVVLFYSQYATNRWQQTGKYYNAPQRNWAFDLNFREALKLPPLTPCIKAMIRGQWTPHE